MARTRTEKELEEVGDYVKIKKLGEGSFGVVYKGGISESSPQCPYSSIQP